MRRLAYAGGALAFVALATLNAGGYRYGASDQAFYIPAILKQLDPSLYPRDTALVGPQARYFFIDEIVAGVVRATGWSMETCFAAGYVLSLVDPVRRALAARTSPVPELAGHLGAHRRRDAAPSHHQDRRQHARRLFPSADAGLRGRCLVDHGVLARPAVAGAGRGPARGAPAPDHRRLLRPVPGGRDLDDRAVRAAGDGRAGHARPGRGVVAAAGGADAWLAVADGRRMARAAGVEGLPVPGSRLGRRRLARQPGHRGAGHRRACASAAERAGQAAGARPARRARWSCSRASS